LLSEEEQMRMMSIVHDSALKLGFTRICPIPATYSL